MSGRGTLRILRVIEWLADQEGPVGLAEIAKALQSPRSSMLEALRLLHDEGYVARDDLGKYTLVRLPGEPFGRHNHLSTLLRVSDEAIKQCVAEAGESGFIGVLENEHIRYVCKVLPDREVRYDRNISRLREPTEVASGIVILAGMTSDELTPFLRGLSDLKKSMVLDSIQRARAEGVALNSRGVIDGAAGMAAPILASDGSVCAAFNIAGPADRVMSQSERLKDLTVATARQISTTLSSLRRSR